MKKVIFFSCLLMSGLLTGCGFTSPIQNEAIDTIKETTDGVISTIQNVTSGVTITGVAGSLNSGIDHAQERISNLQGELDTIVDTVQTQVQGTQNQINKVQNSVDSLQGGLDAAANNLQATVTTTKKYVETKTDEGINTVLEIKDKVVKK